jgi:hypothetical protein
MARLSAPPSGDSLTVSSPGITPIFIGIPGATYIAFATGTWDVSVQLTGTDPPIGFELTLDPLTLDPSTIGSSVPEPSTWQ